MTSIEITTSNVIIDAAAKVNYKVYDQYGVEMAKNADTFNWTVVNTTAAARAVAPTFGAVPYVTLNTNGTPAAQIGDVLRVTGLLTTDPTVIATKDITVSNIYTNEFAFGEVVLPTDAQRLMLNAGYVEIGYTATDNLGNAVTLSNVLNNANVASVNGIQFISSDESIIPVKDAANNFTVTNGKLKFKVLNKAGDVTLTALNTNTGVATSKKITVNAAAKATTMEFGDFKDQEIITGDTNETAKLAVTFIDQYGTAIKNDTYGMTTDFNIVVTGAGVAPLTVNPSLVGGYMVFNDKTVTPGTYTITLTNKTTGVSAAKQVVVNAARVPNELKVVTTPRTAIIAGSSTTAKFEVYDQYGKKMTGTETEASKYEVVATTVASASKLTAPTNNQKFAIGTTAGQAMADITITAGAAPAAIGTETATFTLQKKAVVTPAAPAVDVDSQAFNVTIVEDASNFVSTTDKTEYIVGENIALTVKAEKPAGTFYNKYNETKTATVTVGAGGTMKTYIRTLTFVDGVATATLPTVVAGAALPVNVTWTGLSPAIAAVNVKVTAATASKFSLSGTVGATTLGIQLQDSAGNDVSTLTGAQVVKVTYPVGANITGSGIDAEGNVVVNFNATSAGTITFGANLLPGTYTVTQGTITGTLTVESSLAVTQAAAETALNNYETKSAAGVNFLTGTNAADSASAKTTAASAIAAYKTAGGGTMFDARKTAADGLDTAGQAIKTAYDVAVTKNTAFEIAITPTTTDELKTALEAVTAEAITSAAATATASAANTYVTDTIAAAKTDLNAAFDITVTDQTTGKGKFTVTAPWLVAADLYDPAKFTVTISDTTNVEVVADGTTGLIVQSKTTTDIATGQTVKVKPLATGTLEAYFGADTEITLNLTPKGTAPTVGEAITIALAV